MNLRKKSVFPLVFFLLFSIAGISKNAGQINPDTIEAVSVSTKDEFMTVIPGGNSVGVTLNSNGVIIVSLTDVTDTQGKQQCPSKDAGLKDGDLIKSFNNKEITSVETLCQAIKESKGKSSSVAILRNNRVIKTTITPITSSKDNTMKIGAWVKDSASGIGTLTFYDPETKYFAALGHGICDTDTGKLISIEEGKILDSTIISVDKGKKGVPGELNGIFSEDNAAIGKITANNDFGIFGNITEDFVLSNQEVEIAKKSEIKPGNAYIYANVEGNLIEKFDIEILRVFSQNDSGGKNMIIKVIDKRLIEKTGGIVQGMSGSPIVQNGKLVGAVTHVFVNDPTKGYGIFIENMIKNN